MTSLFAELRRRNVFKVAIAYAVVAWLLIQVANNFFPPLGLPRWSQTLVAVLILIGFPVALLLAWAYELRPDRATPVPSTDGDGPAPLRRLGAGTYAIAGLAVIALSYFAIDAYRHGRDAPDSPQAFSPRDPAAPPTAVASDVAAVAAPPSAEGRGGPLVRSLAILPFENLSPNPADEYFAAGIHEQVLSRLGKIGELTVIARPAVLGYVGGETPIREIARELKVQAIGGGSVRYAGGAVRVTAYLVDAMTGAQLWAESYTRPFEDLFAIETDVATEIAAALEAELAPSVQRSLETQPTTSADAYSLYLRALSAGTISGGLGVEQEQVAEFHRHLDRALELDPAFALGLAAKARDYAYSMGRTLPRSAGLSPEDRGLIAIANAERALALDPNLGLAYAAIAVVHRFHWRQREARVALDRALELSPNDYQVLFDAALFSTYTGDEARAIELARRAVEINPVDGYLPLGLAYLFNGRLAEAAEQFELRAAQGGFRNRFILGQIEALRGNHAAALEQLRYAESVGFLPPTTIASAAYLYHHLGAAEDAARLLTALETFAEENAIGPADWALAASTRGDRTAAVRWLQRAAVSPSPGSDWQSTYLILTNHYADPVLDEPMFTEVRARLGWR